MDYFQNLQDFENTRWQFDKNIHSQTSIENHLVLFLHFLREAPPTNPYFCLKPGKHYATLTSFMTDISELASFPFIKVCQIHGLDGIENLAMISL